MEDYTEPKTKMGFWMKIPNQQWTEPIEELALDCDESWETWAALNRLRTDTAWSSDTLHMWGYTVDSNLCEGGVQ